MGKITLILQDDVERALREHVIQNYPEQPFGKLSFVVNESIKIYLESQNRRPSISPRVQDSGRERSYK